MGKYRPFNDGENGGSDESNTNAEVEVLVEEADLSGQQIVLPGIVGSY
jgi:hypothetical protein